MITREKFIENVKIKNKKSDTLNKALSEWNNLKEKSKTEEI